ncbi:hypothetical protein LCGC14_2847280 [marine sediment metagenome]|uniref:Peptidase M56 domain-containing protein n=1 Tax=marine sediment metagenome TaxID=412755 RepID=A0A0F9B0G7_9ZZZZ
MKKILGFLWALPASILCWLFYILPLIIFKEIKYVGKLDTFVWEFRNPINPTSWYDELWARWAGWSGPCVVIIHEDMYALPEKLKIIRQHELKHCQDQFKWGFFFYPAYLCASAWLAVSNLWKKYEDRVHIYYSNPFEIAARKAAGQVVDIPREWWPSGPDDYNPWM